MDDTSKITGIQTAPGFELDYIELGPKGIGYLDYSLKGLSFNKWASSTADDEEHQLEDWHCLNVALIACPSLKGVLERAFNHIGAIDPTSPVAKELRETLMQVRV